MAADDEPRLGDLPEDARRKISADLADLADLIAADRGHSHVSSEARTVIKRIADEELAAGGVVQTEIVSDWLERQGLL
jgi:hypothetical protein